jgi:hypothetical protein
MPGAGGLGRGLGRGGGGLGGLSKLPNDASIPAKEEEKVKEEIKENDIQPV